MADLYPFIKLSEATKPGSFWHPHLSVQSRTIHFVYGDDPSVCIGEVAMQARRRWKWSRYDKPVKTDTSRKTKPKVVESHSVPTISSAIWALRTSHANATKGVVA